jgi:hypothetical protein
MITQPAVYEFLVGRREISLPYAEAILEALGPRIVAMGPGKAAEDGGDHRPHAGTDPPQDSAKDRER